MPNPPRTTLVAAGSTETQQHDWGSITWCVSAEIGNSQAMTCGKVVMKPGESNPRHRHDACDEILCLLSGELSHYAEDIGEVHMGPGDMIVLPAGIAHNATSTGETDAEMIVVYNSAHRDMHLAGADK